ncbi:site-specific integrase [Phyllobacterium sp. OV277]|uniref:tyrosine-type recombinase/integrase n=1 Tax=Phyllobacterium sp. OV277 TaxID=1882772 RepID=UPI00088C8000|nr:site-specific integrase [Phyllobacterium sp. OV277]SDO57211.1 Site-specific recombinase XerD [Phyllobacterium sp. OV277]
MRKHHPKNERIKRQYLFWLEEAKRLSPTSADQAAAAIALFEASTGYKDFSAFNIEQARRFKRLQNEAVKPDNGKPLAKITIHSRLMALKAFFHWLAGQPGYKSKISYSDSDYFNPSANDSRIATAKREKSAPDLGQIRHVIKNMKSETIIEQRDRALIAFAILTGARDDALASMSLRHVNLEKHMVFQDARDVRTKNRKTFTTWFFPVGDDLEMIVHGWIATLKTKHLFGSGDPLFPQTRIGLDQDGQFSPLGIERKPWKNASAIRRIFSQAFAQAGLPYFNPHSFRTTLARLGETLCRSPEEFKAWSQNLGHEHVLTTFRSYGEVPSHRQAEIINKLGNSTQTTSPAFDPAAIAGLEAFLKSVKTSSGSI